MKIDKLIGKRIRERREELGLTQVHLAELIGASEPQMSRYENGGTSVKPELMTKIAKALRVNPGYFMEGI
jgi:transcriptional regulator with XRE-family HTH domain